MFAANRPTLRHAFRARQALLPCGVILLVALAGLLQHRGPNAAARRDRPPNILFLLSDDQRWDAMGCAGNPIIYTPNMDALARRGVRFRNAFATTPICAASRASLLTGLYERTHGFTFGTPPLSKHALEQSYPMRLRRAGYRTGLIGKFGVVVPTDSGQAMFDSFRQLTVPYYHVRQTGRRHLSEDMRDTALAFLRKCTPEQPFCLSISFNAPHTENSPRAYVPPPEEEPLYQGVHFTPPKTMTPEFFNAQPKFLRTSMARARWQGRFDTPQRFQQRMRDYYRLVSGLDRNIGRIMSTLEDRGLADNTVIIFASDNGSAMGARGFAGKWFGYEYSLRVPLLICDPRVLQEQRGRVIDPMALNVDVPATILDLAGIRVPAQYQGRSLAPFVRGETPPDWRKDFLFEHHLDEPQIPKSEGVRTERWTYIRWYEQKPLVEDLYDHEADFDETRNLVRDPAFAATLRMLRRRTDRLAATYASARPGLVASFAPTPQVAESP